MTSSNDAVTLPDISDTESCLSEVIIGNKKIYFVSRIRNCSRCIYTKLTRNCVIISYLGEFEFGRNNA